MGFLITLGAFGVTVMYDLWNYRQSRNLALNTRFTLVSTVIFTAVGSFVILLDGNFHSLIFGDRTLFERFAGGIFTIVSARTAGVGILPLEQLTDSTQLLILLWMFIGGAPASMAGGISTSTVMVLLVAVLATARGSTSAVSFHRTVPQETIAKAVAIITVSTLLVVIITLLISFRLPHPIFEIGFEVVSAFANAGYSLGFTDSLDTISRYMIAFTMFWGRLGPLTIVVALAQREQPTLIRYAEEPVILG
jgi:trk system potassium uptake protein TrkH